MVEGDPYGMYARMAPASSENRTERQESWDTDSEPVVVPEYSDVSRTAQTERSSPNEHADEDGDMASQVSTSSADPGASETPMFKRIQGSSIRKKLQSLRKVSTVENLYRATPPTKLRIVPPSPFYAAVDMDVPESIEEHDERMQLRTQEGEEEDKLHVQVPNLSTIITPPSPNRRPLHRSRSFSGWFAPSPVAMENDVLRTLQHLRVEEDEADEELEDVMYRIRNAFRQHDDDD